MFWIGLIVGGIIGFGVGVVMLVPFINQVSYLEDMLMQSRSDLDQIRDRFRARNN